MLILHFFRGPVTGLTEVRKVDSAMNSAFRSSSSCEKHSVISVYREIQSKIASTHDDGSEAKGNSNAVQCPVPFQAFVNSED